MKKILVIEDDEPLCWLLERILNDKYEVHVVNNGLKALSWLSKGNVPDLIISDLNMPALDGKKLLETVKNSGFYHDIPVIILSCHMDDRTRMECLELGAADYFVKPFNPQVIKNRVKDLFFNSLISSV
jgi:two-component system, chemotaxis family, chemotaxis protein CheY